MNRRLFVGNLHYDVTDHQLKETFSLAGAVVSAKVISDKETGRSRGFGFVEMTTTEDAQAAIERFHQMDFAGRKLTVNVAKEREERPSGDRQFRQSGHRDNRRFDHRRSS